MSNNNNDKDTALPVNNFPFDFVCMKSSVRNMLKGLASPLQALALMIHCRIMLYFILVLHQQCLFSISSQRNNLS